jgi:hypothetical protein
MTVIRLLTERESKKHSQAMAYRFDELENPICELRLMASSRGRPINAPAAFSRFVAKQNGRLRGDRKRLRLITLPRVLEGPG